MVRLFLAAAGTAGALAACTTKPSLHHQSELAPGVAYLCLAPDGTLARETFDGGTVACPPPARFVSQPYCTVIPAAPRDIAGFYRARAAAARDGSLAGDSFEGQPFCAPVKGGPPLG